jgi:triacylglycerol lipase
MQGLERLGLLPQVYDIPREFGSGLILLGLSWLGTRTACTRRFRPVRPMVYLHGISARAGTVAPMRLYMAARGLGTGFAYEYETSPDIDGAAAGLSRRLDQVVQAVPPTPGNPLVLIGHSLGGLIIRRYLQLFPGRHPVKQVFLVSVPNTGTHLAHYFPTEVTTMLLPGSEFLEDLNDGSHLKNGIRYGYDTVCMYGDRDLFVLPRESMHLSGADVVVFPQLGHNNMMLSTTVMAEIAGRLPHFGDDQSMGFTEASPSM